MLYLLTGDVQIGKTRWLQRMAAELMRDGVAVAGVLAPGVWCERASRGASGEGRFEKLGIDNVLLPGGERIGFARRRDLALAEGSFDPTSQSAAAQLAWEISDDAIDRVNDHFDNLAVQAQTGRPFRSAYPPDNRPPRSADDIGMFHVKHPFVQMDDLLEEADGAGDAAARSAAADGAGAAKVRAAESCGLLVVDELGRLELMCDGGLTSAVALLEAGPTPRCPHALVVVRDWLCPCAEERFSGAWGGAQRIGPDDEARALVRAAFGLPA